MGNIIIAIVVALFFLTLGLLAFYQKRNKPRVLNQVKQQFAGEGVLSLCGESYFLGKTPSGPRPAGGYGAWVLTAKRIYFRAYVGPCELDLPFERILEVKTSEKFEVAKGIANHYRGKEGKMLMCVRFMEDNEEYRTAWYVSGLEQKMELLRGKVLVTQTTP